MRARAGAGVWTVAKRGRMKTMINLILSALVGFYREADQDTFSRIFGPAAGPCLWQRYTRQGLDVIDFYANLHPDHQILFQTYLSAALPAGCCHPPICEGCFEELSEADIQAGEKLCLDCAADFLTIEHEEGALLATVRARLEE